MSKLTLALFSMLLILSSCSGGCDQNDATNKMLALGKVQARMFARGGEGLDKFATQMMIESGTVSELIAQQKYKEACAKADEIAATYKLDLNAEAKDMVTAEQLAKDGGKGEGRCSIADAAKKQMELHGKLQAAVDAGKMDSDIFSKFNDDTRGYAEMLSTNPSKACDLLDELEKKYGV